MTRSDATPIERSASLVIGTVEFVSPSEIKVLLEVDAPQATALNTGVPIGFPRINSYVLVPNEVGAVVGMVSWIAVEKSSFPKRMGVKDFGLIDLPFPLRKLAITPLGTLTQTLKNGSLVYKLERGVSAFPSVGDSVLLPTEQQFRCIVEAADEEDRRVQIGTSPMAQQAAVSVDPNKMFGRHLAVLGNTGSGKSCSVAGLIRWSLNMARQVRSKTGSTEAVNARFIILDPNGEYAAAFADKEMEGVVRRFAAPPSKSNIADLVLPAWMWNGFEWGAFANAAPRVQRPMLMQALRELRAHQTLSEPIEFRVSRLFGSYKARIELRLTQGANGYAGFPQNTNCGHELANIAQDATSYVAQTQGDLQTRLDALSTSASATAAARHWQSGAREGYNDFNETELRSVLTSVEAVLAALPEGIKPSIVSEDAPIPFDVSLLPEHLDQIASNDPSGRDAQFVATLNMRIKGLLADQRLSSIVNPPESATPSFENWLNEIIGEDTASNGQVAILDLSLVPADVLHTVIAVVARIVFEAVQRYRKLTEVELPTVLVLEEAHTFVHRGGDEEDNSPSPSQMCRNTFERIAREGRKFGLGLVLSSQRPSELSPTVLAQCNTFLLHRIVNDRDQELVGKLVPDNLGGLLKELPSLPSRQAILLGWATPVPVMVEILELPHDHRPRSADPHFWEVWTGQEERRIDWKHIGADWVGGTHSDVDVKDAKDAGSDTAGTEPVGEL